MGLKILLVEDLQEDVELIQRELRKFPQDIIYKVVDNKDDFIKELKEFFPDIILSDYNLPQFSGLEAIEIVKEFNNDIPIIIVTGSINENVAVECMKRGAWDYVIKEYLMKLPTSIKAALEKREIILEKKKAIEELEKSEKRFKTLLNTAPLGTIVINKDKKIIYANQRALEIVELTSVKDVMWKNLIDFVDEENKDFVMERVDKILSGKKLPPAIEKIKTIQGNQKYINVNSIALTLDGENVVVAMFEDITEKKILEQKLLQSQKMEAIGKLAGGIAHDFNNILTVINGYAELILTMIDRDNLVYDKVLQIYKAGEKASNLTKQILAFSRKQLIMPKVLNINEIIKQNLKMLKRLVRENIEIKVEFGKDIGFIKADPVQLEQIFLNLTINSIDAMPNGGTIKIKTSKVQIADNYIATNLNIKKGSYVLITFSDTGMGIDEKIIDKIFEPFFTTKKVGEGSGLGLSTVYGIVKQNNGYIFANSTLNKGTTFKIFWPLVDKKDFEESKDKKEDVKYNKGSENILIIEDDKFVREVIYLGLKEFGYNVFQTDSRDEAIGLIENENINLLITDIIMPNFNGIEIARELKTINPELKVLFISGYADNIFKDFSISKKNFLQKPFSFEKLLKKVRELLE